MNTATTTETELTNEDAFLLLALAKALRTMDFGEDRARAWANDSIESNIVRVGQSRGWCSRFSVTQAHWTDEGAALARVALERFPDCFAR